MKEISKQHSFIVTTGEDGMRLDRTLQKRYGRINRSEWQRRIRSGKVFVEENSIKPAYRVREGEKIEFLFRQKEEPAVNRNFQIVHEDESLLIIDKPPNLPVHPAGIYHNNTLLFLLREIYGNDYKAYFAHRLDRETSGLLILGKTKKAASELNRSFRDNKVVKEYLVIVEGSFPEYIDARGIIFIDRQSVVRKKRKFLLQNAQKFVKESISSQLDARQCRTEFFLTKKIKEISVVHARLHTGRMHQIRASLSSLGYAVVGDRLYGVDENLYLKFINDRENADDRIKLRTDRTALHCNRLELPHPHDGKRMVFTSKLPEDLAHFITEMG